MPYREELEASLARAQAAEDELATARRDNAHDHERLAELEKQLAEARRDVPVAEEAPPKSAPTPPLSPPTWSAPTTTWQRLTQYGWGALIPLVVVSIVVADEIYKYVKKKSRPLSSLTVAVPTTRIDLMAEEARAQADARTLAADATLVQIDTQSIVDASGSADLTKGFVTFEFFAPSKMHYIHVSTNQRNRQTTDMSASGSGLRIHDPKCSAIDVWTEAIRRGAPPSSLASLRLGMTKDGPAWTFECARSGDKPFTMTLLDECPIAR